MDELAVAKQMQATGRGGVVEPEPRPDDQLEKELVDRRETAIQFADRLRSELREQERIVEATGAALNQLQMDQAPPQPREY